MRPDSGIFPVINRPRFKFSFQCTKCVLDLPKIFVRLNDFFALKVCIALQNIKPVISLIALDLLGVKFWLFTFDLEELFVIRTIYEREDGAVLDFSSDAL